MYITVFATARHWSLESRPHADTPSLKIHYNITLSSTPNSVKSPPPLRFSDQKCVQMPDYFPHVLHYPITSSRICTAQYLVNSAGYEAFSLCCSCSILLLLIFSTLFPSTLKCEHIPNSPRARYMTGCWNIQVLLHQNTVNICSNCYISITINSARNQSIIINKKNKCDSRHSQRCYARNVQQVWFPSQ
jgi:hypothetical protein